MKSTKVILVILVITALSAVSAEAKWLIYHEPAFNGTVLDIDTKKPIEGAVVVAVYRKATMGLGAGSIDSIIKVRETLTDSSGNFHIPSYTTLIQPFSWQILSSVIIFKPGHASVQIESRHFTGKDLKTEQVHGWYWTKELKYILRGKGIVELPQVETTEERINSLPPIPGPGISANKMQTLIMLSNKERVSLGLRPEEWL